MSGYYYSPVSDYDGPVVECEGKEASSSDIAGGTGPNGYRTYYYYKNCRKAYFRGDACPTGNGYVAPARPWQQIRSRQDPNDPGTCLASTGEDGSDAFVAPCAPDDARTQWVVSWADSDRSTRVARIKAMANQDLCLDMHQTDTVNNVGYRLYLHACHDGKNQKFEYDAGRLLQRYTLNNYCVDWWFDGGSTVYMPKCHTSIGDTTKPNQQWDFLDP
jgi:hypothetical protein